MKGIEKTKVYPTHQATAIPDLSVSYTSTKKTQKKLQYMLDSTTFINSERVVKSLPTSGMTRTKGLKNPRCKKKNGDSDRTIGTKYTLQKSFH